MKIKEAEVLSEIQNGAILILLKIGDIPSWFYIDECNDVMKISIDSLCTAINSLNSSSVNKNEITKDEIQKFLETDKGIEWIWEKYQERWWIGKVSTTKKFGIEIEGESNE